MNPYRLAFARWDDKWWMTIDAVWDVIFLIDIILTFFKAFHNKDFLLIDDRKEIAKTYLSGWFFFDLLSILPVYYFCQRRDHLTLFRHLKLVSLPALMKFNKYIKLLKRKFGLARFFCRNISFSVEFERLLSLVITFFLGCHLIACLWILIADVFEREKNNWIVTYELEGRSDLDIYMISFYFIITTLSTVGYGDFSPQTNLERVYVMFLEILGIIFFSFAIGSLTTIIENLNSYDEDLVQKLDTLEGIKRD